MTRLGLIDLEILFLGIKKDGNFDERDIESSNLKRLGVGRILDSLASLKDRKLINLNSDGSFSITDLARHVLWDGKIPLGVRILRILEIKSFSTQEISEFLRESEQEVFTEMENLRKNQLILMSPQRIESKIIKIYEILPEGSERLKNIEREGFKQETITPKPEIEVLSLINQILKEINESDIITERKENIISKLSLIKEKLGL